MKKRPCDGQVNFIKTLGIPGLSAYLLGVIQGYLKGFSGEHRAARWAGRVFACMAAFAIAVSAVYVAVPTVPGLQKETEMDTVIVQAAEETLGLDDTVEKTVHPIQTPLEKEAEALPEMTEATEAEAVKGPEPLDDSIMEPSDTFVEKGGMAVFKAYHPKAEEYQWEIYDAGAGSWEKAPQEAVSGQEDELQRKISSLSLAADQERQVRCQISIGGVTPVSYEADLHILSGQISSISADEFSADAGSYASAREIPVKVTYQDGTDESVTGLTGLYFLEQQSEATASGDMEETITTVKTAHEYDYIDPGSREGILLYRKSDGDSMEIPVNIKGVDQTAPKITDLHIGGFEVSNVDKEVPVTVTIRAEDDVTPLRHLTYAFLPEGEEPQETDWTDQPVFQTGITKNGVWMAYCRDEAGNTATKEQEIIAVDTRAPVITLTLDKEDWCQENRIFVSAEDTLAVEYRYLCEETGEDSGWVKKGSISVSENGNWTVQVRDAVGNVAEKGITVDNIDTKAPVILGIKEESEGEIISNEE